MPPSLKSYHIHHIMKNISYAISFAFALYILIEVVNWSEPKFFDYSIIAIYTICLLLVTLNIVLLIIKKRNG